MCFPFLTLVGILLQAQDPTNKSKIEITSKTLGMNNSGSSGTTDITVITVELIF